VKPPLFVDWCALLPLKLYNKDYFGLKAPPVLQARVVLIIVRQLRFLFTK